VRTLDHVSARAASVATVILPVHRVEAPRAMPRRRSPADLVIAKERVHRVKSLILLKYSALTLFVSNGLLGEGAQVGLLRVKRVADSIVAKLATIRKNQTLVLSFGGRRRLSPKMGFSLWLMQRHFLPLHLAPRLRCIAHFERCIPSNLCEQRTTCPLLSPRSSRKNSNWVLSLWLTHRPFWPLRPLDATAGPKAGERASLVGAIPPWCRRRGRYGASRPDRLPATACPVQKIQSNWGLR
jgi:hypothetical protein